MSGATKPGYLKLTIQPDPGFTLNLDAFKATEELGRPFLFELELSSPKLKSDITSMLGTNVTITAQQQGGSTRYYNGIVAKMVYVGLGGGTYRYRMELRPWIWLLGHTRDCAIFQNKSVWTTITSDIFSAKGFTSYEDKRQASAGSTVLEYCVQYRETALDFVTRLMERYGIYYYFKHSEGQHTLVLADDPNSHTAISPAIPFAAYELEYRAVKDCIWDWSAELNFHSGSYVLTDYNFTTPAANMMGKLMQPGSHAHASLEVFDYPAAYATPEDATKLATIRMQEITARRKIMSGCTNARGIVTGGKFTLSDMGDTSLNIEYLVISSVTTFNVAEGLSDTGGDMADTYRCTFHAIPGEIQYRLHAATPWPAVQGPQNAKVVGESGQEITTDKYGRIKVQFYWDRVGQSNENSSCWIRVTQPWAGASWGAMFIPRIGQEVIVDFIEGNPDRPIVTGRVYNASLMPPYGLPGKMNVSTIMSNSTKGGGGSNELRFDDTKGKEEVYFHAQYDYNKIVLHDETVTITNDTTTTVKEGKRSVTVQTKDNELTVSQGNNTTTVSQGNNSTTVSQGNNSLTVSQGNNSTTVSLGNDSLTVSAGNHSITVSAGKSDVTAMQSITLTVGENSIKIDTSGVTITAAKLAITAMGQISAEAGGQVSIESGGPMSLESGAPMTIMGPMVAIN